MKNTALVDVNTTFAGESLNDLHRGTRISISYLSRIRGGLRIPGTKTAQKIAMYVGMSTDDLLAEIYKRKEAREKTPLQT